METTEILNSLNAFDEKYQYDSTYMKDLLDSSPEGFKTFHGFMPMAQFRQEAEPIPYFLSKIVATQSEDCGSCLQLVVRMAQEAGISNEIIEGGLNQGKGLSSELKDVYDFTIGVAANQALEESLVERMEKKHGKTGISELSLCIASAKVFPTLKRALGYAKSCSLVTIEV